MPTRKTPLELAKTAFVSSLLAGCAAPLLVLYYLFIFVFDAPHTYSGPWHTIALFAGLFVAVGCPLLFGIPLLRARRQIESGIGLEAWNESQIAEAFAWVRSQRRNIIALLAFYLTAFLVYLIYWVWAYATHMRYRPRLFLPFNACILLQIPTLTMTFLREKLAPASVAPAPAGFNAAPLHSEHWGQRTYLVEDSKP